MKDRKPYALRYISEVAGYGKFYIVILLLVQMLLGISSVFYALLLRGIIDAAVLHDRDGMVLNSILFVGLVVGQIALRAVVRFMEEFSKATYENAFKKRLFGELLSRDYGKVTSVHSGEWMNRLTSDTVVVAEGLATIIPSVSGMITRMAGALVVILIMEPRFGYILIPGGILLVFLTYAFRKRLKKLHKRMQEKDGIVRIFLQEHLGSLMIVKAFGREEDRLLQAEDKMKEHRKARMKKNHFSNICNVGFGSVMNGAYVLGAVYGAVGIYNGTMSYGTFMAILQLISQIQNPFANITGYLPKYFAMIASAERLMEVQTYERDILSSQNKVCLEENLHEMYEKRIISVGLEHVDFTYLPPVSGETADTAMPVVLKDYSIDVKKGEFVAFTGPSGCGKSTVLKLLMGLYHIDKGRGYVMIEGEKSNINRKLFAYVPQGNHLMSGSIRDIITFSDAGRKNDEEGICRALKVACADVFVSELEQGIDTLLGERGLGLSEGQMQRLAIARAVYSERPILLLDEATSSLDSDTENAVLRNLRSMTDKTVIIVTHRPAALKLCDREICF